MPTQFASHAPTVVNAVLGTALVVFVILPLVAAVQIDGRTRAALPVALDSPAGRRKVRV